MARGELTDDEWFLIEPHLPLGERGPIPDLRQQFDAVMWRFRTGSPWRDLPAEYGPCREHVRLINHSKIRWTSVGHFATIRTVTDEADRQTSFPTSSKHVRFVGLSRTVMSALLDGDLPAASNTAGVALTEYFVTDRARWLWRFRIDQMAADPRHAQWMARQAVTGPEGIVIGHAGFHGPPDEAGTVEIGYAVAPDFRRQGYGRAILIELLRRAAAEPAVKTVRATISPDNVASLATIAGFGFVEVGEHWDEEDGLGLIFEVPANRSC